MSILYNMVANDTDTDRVHSAWSYIFLKSLGLQQCPQPNSTHIVLTELETSRLGTTLQSKSVVRTRGLYTRQFYGLLGGCEDVAGLVKVPPGLHSD